MALAKQVRDAVKDALVALQDLAIEGRLLRRTAKEHVPGQAQRYSSTTYEVKFVIGSYKHNEIDGTLVRSGDIRITLFPFESEPSENDLLFIGISEFRIVRHVPTYVGDQIAAYDVQLRNHVS